MKQFIKDSLRFIKRHGLKEYCSQLWHETWDFISCEYLKPYLNIETKAYLRWHDKHTVLKDGFLKRSMASAWARKNVKAKSWLIEGYKHRCVIEFNERDFNAANNLY